MTVSGTKLLTIPIPDSFKKGPSCSSKPNGESPQRTAEGLRMSEDNPFYLGDTFSTRSINIYEALTAGPR